MEWRPGAGAQSVCARVQGEEVARRDYHSSHEGTDRCASVLIANWERDENALNADDNSGDNFLKNRRRRSAHLLRPPARAKINFASRKNRSSTAKWIHFSCRKIRFTTFWHEIIEKCCPHCVPAILGCRRPTKRFSGAPSTLQLSIRRTIKTNMSFALSIRAYRERGGCERVKR